MVDVVTPAAGESVTEGTILEWHVKVGDFIKADATIVEISTDKVDVELPAPASGTVSELLVQEGDTVTVGQVIARISVADSDGAPASASDRGNGSQATAEPGAREARPAAQRAGDGQAASELKVSPVAARAAAVEGVDLAHVSGSGPAGRITKSDVLSAASGNGATRAASAPESGALPTGRAAAAIDEGQRGGARALHGAVALDPHGDQLPHADGDRAGRARAGS